MSDVVKVAHVEQLQDLLDNNETVVLLFHAPSWCAPCRKFHPHFESAAEKSDAVFAEVDIDETPAIADAYKIMSVPTVKLFIGGEYIKDLKARTVLPLLGEISS